MFLRVFATPKTFKNWRVGRTRTLKGDRGKGVDMPRLRPPKNAAPALQELLPTVRTALICIARALAGTAAVTDFENEKRQAATQKFLRPL
jgi:hypothetical protein